MLCGATGMVDRNSWKFDLSDWRFIIRFIGILLLAEGGAMLSCLVPALHFGDGHVVDVVLASGITIAAGAVLFFFNRRFTVVSDRRRAYLMVTLMWVALSLFGALPYFINFLRQSQLDLSFRMAVSGFAGSLFESVSGLTATGATVFADVEALPTWILLWRSMSQWLGGFGIIMMVLAIAPRLGINKYSLYTAEMSGADNTRKTSIRMNVTVRRMLVIYIVLTILFVMALMATGLQLWDAANLVFTNISSGGFSIYNDGISRFSHVQQYIVAAAMLVSGISFALLGDIFFLRFARVRQGLDQLRFYLIITLLAIMAVVFGLKVGMNYGWEQSVRCGIVQTISAVTTSGTLVDDTSKWWMPVNYMFVILSLCGAMAGSTSGGLKCMRVLILVRSVRHLLRGGMHPGAVNPIRLNGRPVSQELVTNVLVIFFVYMFTLLLGTMALLLCGVGATESIGAVVGCISGYGPGLGPSGGFGCYAGFPVMAKTICSVIMVLGRLECLTVFIILTPKFWHR